MKQDLMLAGAAAGLLFTLSNSPGADALTGKHVRTAVDYVNSLIDAHKSRWIYFSSACRPFGWANLSPDIQSH